MTSTLMQTLREYKAWDEARDSFTGEHWLVFGAGMALLLAANRSYSGMTRLLGSAAGAALLYRAASGRDGLKKLMQYLPSERGLLR